MTAAVVGDAMFVQGQVWAKRCRERLARKRAEREFQEWAAADNKYVNRVLHGWIHNKYSKQKNKEKQERTAKRQELFRAQWQEAWDKQMMQEQLEDYKWKKAFQDVWGRGSYRFWSKKVKKEMQEEDGGWEEEFGLVTVG